MKKDAEMWVSSGIYEYIYLLLGRMFVNFLPFSLGIRRTEEKFQIRRTVYTIFEFNLS